MDELFKYENQRKPPSLSDKEKLRSGNKSDMLQCLTIPKVITPDNIAENVLDASAVVHMIRPTKATDFQQYVDHHFIPYIASVISESTSPVDIIGDTYPDHNIKAQTQSRRGTPGEKTVVAPFTPIPHDWKKFLGFAENKIELFRYISKAIAKAEPLRNVLVHSTYDDTVLINSSDQQSAAELKTIMPCNHQEADGRIFLHRYDAAKHGHSKAFIRTVVVIAIGHFSSLGTCAFFYRL